jgi:hypothetical protein
MRRLVSSGIEPPGLAISPCCNYNLTRNLGQ